jgi:hypothetical protein
VRELPARARLQPLRKGIRNLRPLYKWALQIVLRSKVQAYPFALAMNPNARTLEYLRREGWLCAGVEKYMKFGNMAFGRRIDVWGFGDVLACHPGDADTPPQIVLVQACAAGDRGRRRRKILGQLTEADRAKLNDKEWLEAQMVAEHAKCWKKCEGKILLIAWAKKGPRGARKTWQPTIEEL